MTPEAWKAHFSRDENVWSMWSALLSGGMDITTETVYDSLNFGRYAFAIVDLAPDRSDGTYVSNVVGACVSRGLVDLVPVDQLRPDSRGAKAYRPTAGLRALARANNHTDAQLLAATTRRPHIGTETIRRRAIAITSAAHGGPSDEYLVHKAAAVSSLHPLTVIHRGIKAIADLREVPLDHVRQQLTAVARPAPPVLPAR
jgi:hypothetical protein